MLSQELGALLKTYILYILSFGTSISAGHPVEWPLRNLGHAWFGQLLLNRECPLKLRYLSAVNVLPVPGPLVKFLRSVDSYREAVAEKLLPV